MRNTTRLAVFFLLLLAVGCSAPSSHVGDVATVNGDSITYAELESRRATLFPNSAKDITSMDDQALRKQYVYALRQLINETLVLQYMQEKKLFPPEELFVAKEAQVWKDYLASDFEEMLLQEGLTFDEWRERFVRHVKVEYFFQTVLRPGVSISGEEVKEYYQEHKGDFNLPEQWHFLQISSMDKAELAAGKKTFIDTGSAATVQQQHKVTVRDIITGQDRLPEEMLAELRKLKPGKFSPVHKSEETWLCYVLLSITPARDLNAAEVYDRVAQVLVEEKMQVLYAAWLQKRLEKSHIAIHNALLKEEN